MNEKYQNCPTCGSLCQIIETDEVGRYRLIHVSDNAELQAENAELRAFVEKVASNESLFQTIDSDGKEVMGLNPMLYYEARALLRGEEGK